MPRGECRGRAEGRTRGALLADVAEPRLAYSVTEILSMVPIGRTRLYAEIASGRLSVVKVGRRTLVTPQALAAWLGTPVG